MMSLRARRIYNSNPQSSRSGSQRPT